MARKDILIEKILKSKATYFALLLILLVYLFFDDKILKYPSWYLASKWSAALLITGMLFIHRINCYREYYKSKSKDVYFIINAALTLIWSTFFISLLINIPVSYYLKETAKNSPLEYKTCEIKNAINNRGERIAFIFEGKTYTRRYDIGSLKREDILKNYYMQIGIRKSKWGTYYLATMKLTPNTSS